MARPCSRSTSTRLTMLVSAVAIAAISCTARVGGLPGDAAVDGEDSALVGVDADEEAGSQSADAKVPCTPATCPGCCYEGECFLGDQDKLCGSGAENCRDCTLNGQTCSGGSCTGACTPYCTDKCQGQDDGCGSPCPTNTCTGCCDGKSTCQKGTTTAACGTGGGSCAVCASGESCFSGGICKCVPSCADKCQGEDDGCGSPCPSTTCTGCCDSNNACQKGDTVAACGTNGGSCIACASGESCLSGGICKCVPSCANVCQGADDGCGSTCPSTTCTGCCDSSNTCQKGSATTACGIGGAACVDCSALSQVCSAGTGTCKCVPDCAGKCQGADDGCGGTCSKSPCGGCCDASKTCLSGNSDSACGNGGSTCVDCAASSQTCKNNGSCG